MGVVKIFNRAKYTNGGLLALISENPKPGWLLGSGAYPVWPIELTVGEIFRN